MKHKRSNYPIIPFNFHSSQGGGDKKCRAIGVKVRLFRGVWYGYTAIKIWQRCLARLFWGVWYGYTAIKIWLKIWQCWLARVHARTSRIFVHLTREWSEMSKNWFDLRVVRECSLERQHKYTVQFFWDETTLEDEFMLPLLEKWKK